MGMPISMIRPGMALRNRLPITPDRVRHFQFARDCADVGGGVTAGARFQVVEVFNRPGQNWLTLAIPGSDPPRTIKITAGEMANLFDPVA
jgi:hypothetical protein